MSAKALIAALGKHAPAKFAALPQAVIPNEARTRSFDEQADSWEAVSGGARVASSDLPQAVIPNELVASNLPQAVIPNELVAYMPSVPVASGDSFLMPSVPVASTENFLS